MRRALRKHANVGSRTVVRELPLHFPLSAGEPAWEIAHLFPLQGAWTETDYLSLTSGNRLVELTGGCIDIPPMPTCSHQGMVVHLAIALMEFARPNKMGTALTAGVPIKLGPQHFRQPDVVFMLARHKCNRHEEYWDGADLVMEVVIGSKKDRRRDLVTKRTEYARAGITEYWIVDSQEESIIVLHLQGKKYLVHDKFGCGDRATSVLLKGFEVDVDAVLSGEGD